MKKEKKNGRKRGRGWRNERRIEVFAILRGEVSI